MQTQQGIAIALLAVEAMKGTINTADGIPFTDTPGDCQKFAREVAEKAGGEPQQVMDSHRTGTAAGTMANFAGGPYDAWNNIGGDNDQPGPAETYEGDFWYKGEATSGPNGHVGIAVAGHRVGLDNVPFVIVENSSFHMADYHPGNVRGACGYRTPAQFGYIELVARLTGAA